MHFALHNERIVLITDTITIDVPARDGGHRTRDVVAAISSAMNAATAQLADQVADRLAPAPAALTRHATQD
jgi:hypothetical protein